MINLKEKNIYLCPRFLSTDLVYFLQNNNQEISYSNSIDHVNSFSKGLLPWNNIIFDNENSSLINLKNLNENQILQNGNLFIIINTLNHNLQTQYLELDAKWMELQFAKQIKNNNQYIKTLVKLIFKYEISYFNVLLIMKLYKNNLIKVISHFKNLLSENEKKSKNQVNNFINYLYKNPTDEGISYILNYKL